VLSFRAPRAEDGPAITALIADCPPLDTNSAYCTLLQCTHFADTCVVAERADGIVGWASAYRPPSAPEQLFVWQVAVHRAARGVGLGTRLLDALLTRPGATGATGLLTTITAPNAASWALFAAFARRCGGTMRRRPIFDRDAHFAGAHDTEHLVSIALPAPCLPKENER
jgi:L-2,4-diaminobutyric acid acetyltransferase